MIAVDTNILVYAHRRDSPFHDRAAAVVRDLAEGARPWAIPWPCVYEFVRVVTKATSNIAEAEVEAVTAATM